VRRRIWVVGAALGVSLLTSVAGPAIAASSHKAKLKKSKPTVEKVVCSTATSIMIANGDSGVSPPASQGLEYGSAGCGAPMGFGVQKDSFTVPTSGDTLAKFTMYFGKGTIHGAYDLTPQQTTLNFLETDWAGTLKVLGGTGGYEGVTGIGSMTCKTLDGIHTRHPARPRGIHQAAGPDSSIRA
jgi:hypothetical protein